MVRLWIQERLYYFSPCLINAISIRVFKRKRANRRHIYIYIYVYEEITRNWLMPLWKLRSYKICSWPAGDPEEVVV